MTRELRDSGVGWLGDIPATWPIVPARALFGERKQKSSANDVHLTPSQKYGVLPQAEYMEITGSKVVLNLSGADNMRHVEAGDYVSHLRSFQGGLEFAGIPGKVSAAYTVLQPKVALEPRFFKYLFKSDLYVQALQTTTDQLRDGQSIRYGQFTSIPLPCPELEVQRAIADYLDRETAQIDAFIAKNEELIALLTERRAAVVDEELEAANDGMASAPAVPLRYLLRFNPRPRGKLPPRSVYLPMEAIGEFRGVDDSRDRPTAELLGAYSYVANGDVAYAKVTPCFENGKGFVATGLRGGCAFATTEVSVLRPRRQLLADFLAWVLQSRDFVERGTAQMTGAGGLKRVPDAFVASYRIPLLPLHSQQRAIARLCRITSDIDGARDAALGGIALARERRAALISAAVTGKIDVGVGA